MMRDKTITLLKDMMRVTGTPALYPIYKSCKECLSNLDRPMRIAITGMIKTGKSTLLNSFLKQYIVPTAVEVLTYNVNWFHHIAYSPSGIECIVVHLHNGELETYSLADLFSCVRFSPEDKEYLDSIHWVDVYLDNPILKEFDLIDTPGLSSLVGTESQHTRDLLTKEENRPDAIVYLMKKGIKPSDIKDVRQFHEATGLMSGINTVAAFSRVDELSGTFADATTIIQDNTLTYSDVKYYFSRIFPIAAIMAEASATLSDKDIDGLIQLSDVKDVSLYLLSKDKFIEQAPILSPEAKKELCSKLSISGIRNIVKYISTAENKAYSDIRSYLYDYSRVENLRQYLINHFGSRARFIIVKQCLNKMRLSISNCLQSKTIIGENRETLMTIRRSLSSFTALFEEEFKSYYIISDYYNEADYFDEETWERARRVLGETGDDDYSKYGIQTSDNRDSLINAEKEYWLNLSKHYTNSANSKGVDVARYISKLLH